MAGKSKFLGFLTGTLLHFVGKNPEFSKKNMKSIDFSSSSQSIGTGLNERVRQIFRFKWINKKK